MIIMEYMSKTMKNQDKVLDTNNVDWNEVCRGDAMINVNLSWLRCSKYITVTQHFNS